MCVCNPNIRSPWCGVGECRQPVQIEYGRYQVYDDRTNTVVYHSNYKSDCIHYLNNTYERDRELGEHLWLR
ncbi:hypothetical protein D3C74_380340 [compost metagenome]